MRKVAISEANRTSTEGMHNSRERTTISPKLFPSLSIASNSKPRVDFCKGFGASSSMASAFTEIHFR